MQDPQLPSDAPATPPPHPPGREPPDTGTRRSRLIALVCVIVFYAALALSQNLSPYMVDPGAEVGRPPRGGEVAKLFLLVDHGLEQSGLGPSGMLGAAGVQEFVDPELHPADRLQAVPLLGEVSGPETALDALFAIRAGLELDASPGSATSWRGRVGEVRAAGTEPGTDWAVVEGADGPVVDEEAVVDARVLGELYRQGPGALTQDERDRLTDRYGWLGELALTHGPEADPDAREALYRKWPWALWLIVLVGAIFGIGLVGGLAMFVVAAVMYFRGSLRPRFVPPAAGGSVYMETFALFLGLFLVVHLVGGVVADLAAQGTIGVSDTALTVGVMAAQWLLLPLLLWPLARGVPLGRWRWAVGWRAPWGIAREVGAGVLGYFAGLPLFFLGVAATFVLNMVAEWLLPGPVAPPSNPVLEMVSSGSVIVLVLFVLLATVWAPIMEETLFRGGLYRHVRARTGAFVAAVVTALLFAYLHSYGPLMTGPLIALGFTFAMMREWRGSLVAPITAHFLHNATVTTIALVALRALG